MSEVCSLCNGARQCEDMGYGRWFDYWVEQDGNRAFIVVDTTEDAGGHQIRHRVPVSYCPRCGKQLGTGSLER